MNISDLVPWRGGRGELSKPAEGETDEFLGLRRQFDRLFDDMLSVGPWPTFESVGDFTPRVNVIDRADGIEVTAELPGLDEKDIDLSVTANALTIKGEKRAEQEQREGGFYRRERRYGSFCRTIPLTAETADLDNVSATFKNGLLTVNIPKKAEAQTLSKRIAVKSG
jgi:HSP20 family protein